MFSGFTGPRRPRGVRQALMAVLAVAVVATLAGASNYRELGPAAADFPQQLLKMTTKPGPASALAPWPPSGT
jgi:hypothetical protein